MEVKFFRLIRDINSFSEWKGSIIRGKNVSIFVKSRWAGLSVISILKRQSESALSSSCCEISQIVIYLEFHSTKRALWLVDSWSRAADQIQNVSRPGYNCAVVARAPNTTACDQWMTKIFSTCSRHLVNKEVVPSLFVCLFVLGKSKYITKHLMYVPPGN